MIAHVAAAEASVLPAAPLQIRQVICLAGIVPRRAAPHRKPLVQRGQPLDLPGQLSDQPVRARQPHRQPGGRQRGQLLSRGQARNGGHNWQ
jgi:hypothetical protein